MTWKLHHTWWTHLPGAACVVGSVVTLVLAHPPAHVPVHFGASGEPDRWGSMWEMWLALVGLPLAMIVGSVVIDEIFARHEDRRMFNWMAIFDEAMLGFFLGMTLVLAPQLSSPHPVLMLKGFLGIALGLSATVAAAACVLEWLRPFRPIEGTIPPGDSAQLSALDLETIGSHRRWHYWETQNPAYVRWICTPVIAVLLVLTVATFSQLPWLLPVFAVSILVILPIYGGLRVSVTPDVLAVRLGIFGLPLLKVRHRDIALIEVMKFSPLADFGGWGIRYSLSKGIWGYFLAGTRGVKVKTVREKQYLIGSNNPEYLAAVCEAARAAANDSQADRNPGNTRTENERL